MPFQTENSKGMQQLAGKAAGIPLNKGQERFQELTLIAPDGPDHRFFFEVFHVFAEDILGLGIILNRKAFRQECQKQRKK